MNEAEEMSEYFCHESFTSKLEVESFFSLFNSITISNEYLADVEKLYHIKISKTEALSDNKLT